MTHGDNLISARGYLREQGLSHFYPNSTPRAELFPPETSFDVETKKCSACKQTLPVRRFYFNRTNGRYFSSCKSCCAAKSKEWKVKHPSYFGDWHKQHAGMQSVYAKRSEANRKAAGRKKKRAKRTPEQEKRAWARVRVRKIARRADIYRARYGDEFARNYVGLMTGAARPKSGRNVIKHLKLVLLPSELSGESWGVCNRVEQLNVLSGQPFGFLGPWKCFCGISSSQPRFFDIDHIIPRAKGGSNGLYNYQILCPNCHRTKTIKDYPHSGFNECVPAAHTPGVISTTASNGADVLTNQAPYMGFHAGVPDAQAVSSPSVILLGPTGRGGSTTEPE